MMDGLPPAVPRPTPRAATPPADPPPLAALTDVVMPLVQSMATMAYEVQQERCALEQERGCVRALLQELRDERQEHRKLMHTFLHVCADRVVLPRCTTSSQAFKLANDGAIKVVSNDVHRAGAVALLLAASMAPRPQ